MPAPLAPWLAVHPTDYLAASQAGANVGLAIARMRQDQQEQRLRLRAASEERAADRQSEYDNLRERLNAARELKLADIAAQQQSDAARIMESHAGHDLQQQGLDFRRSQEEFDQDQARRKLLLAADSNEQEGRLMRGVAEDRSPEGIIKSAGNNPLAKSALSLTNHALNLEAAKKIREEEVLHPKPTAAMRDSEAGRAKVDAWINGGSRLDLIEGSKLLGLNPDTMLGVNKDLTTSERNTIIGKVQSLMLLRQKQTNAKKKEEIDSMISEWKNRYPEIFGGSTQLSPQAGMSLPSTNSFQTGKYKVTL